MQKISFFRFVFFCLNFCFVAQVFSSQTLPSDKQLGFKSFLHSYYQSQTTPPPTIPSYTITKIIPPQEIPPIAPRLKILGPIPKAIDVLKPSVTILGIDNSHSKPFPVPKLKPTLIISNQILTKEPVIKSKNDLPKLAIVIDDIGNNKSLDTRVAELPGAITIAILPYTPHSKTIAKLAYLNNKEIMLHVPMESLEQKRLGEGGLTKNLSEEEFNSVLQGDIDSIPHVVGLNNHMGSALTQDEASMRLVMQAIIKNNLYFVDSRTTAQSVASRLAQEYKINHVTRNVFLDNEATFEYIDAAFKKAIKISQKTGFALAIGHPYPNTISYLENALPELEKQGVSLILVSDLLIARAEKNINQQKDLVKN